MARKISQSEILSPAGDRFSRIKDSGKAPQAAKPIDDTEQTIKELPDAVQTEKALPQVGSPENTVTIAGRLIEIKPTKLLYQRNRTAAFYKMLE